MSKNTDKTIPILTLSPDSVLVLRCVHPDMTSSRGFTWPTEGEVSAPDWRDDKECGGGLHGWLWGQGDITTANGVSDVEGAKWLVVEVSASDVRDLGGKVKYPRGFVHYVGDAKSAAEIVGAFAPQGSQIIYGTATAGYAGTATAGYAGTATAGYAGTATAGDAGTATAGDAGTATAGDAGTATAGEDGLIILLKYDPAKGKYKKVIGQIGEGGIEANVPYKLDDNGKLVRK